MTTYKDIKDLEVSRTHSLENVKLALPYLPLGTRTDLLHYVWDIGNSEHPLIECVTHAFMRLDDRRYNTIFSVLVDGVPAFLFMAAGREGRDVQNYYPLNNEACKQCVKYMIELIPRGPAEVLPPEVSEDEEIEALVEFNGLEMVYGKKCYRDDNGNWQTEVEYW